MIVIVNIHIISEHMTQEYIEVEYIDGVTLYRFLSNSRDAYDEYLRKFKAEMQKHVDAGKQDQPYPFILDVSNSGMFSINYMMQATKPIIASFDPFPENYIAYLTDNMNDSVLIHLLDGLTARGFAHKRKLFHIDDKHKAIEWLKTI